MALVGTRRPSPAAQTAARALTAALIDRGATIVSGLALGIDSLAHHEALAGSGRTLAVLGGGVLNVYPPQHAHLADAISARGALLCEVAPDAAVGSPGLVARNRIITGLAECVFIVESQTDGGAMHAGRFAREQGRRLFTLDLPASGNRALIAAGAVALPVDADALVDRLDGVLDTPG
jgi:DNA processing protein